MPSTSTSSHQSLASALAAFQADLPAVTKNKTAKVPTKSGGEYRYTYADLADISAVAFPRLAEHGLAFTVTPRWSEVAGAWEVAGKLMHGASGESVAGSLPLFGTSPQQLGSSLTYARRYLLGALTGLVTDDDDDGGAAQRARATTSRPPVPPRQDWSGDPEPKSPGAQGSPLLNTSGPLARAMYAAIREAGIPKENVHDLLSDVTGRTIGSSKELTDAEARMVLDHLPTQPTQSAGEGAPQVSATPSPAPEEEP